jgi:hypothetical protein
MENGISRFIKISAGMIVAYGIGIMVNYGNIKGTAEYTDATTRGGTELTIKADGSPRDIKTIWIRFRLYHCVELWKGRNIYVHRTKL